MYITGAPYHHSAAFAAERKENAERKAEQGKPSRKPSVKPRLGTHSRVCNSQPLGFGGVLFCRWCRDSHRPGVGGQGPTGTAGGRLVLLGGKLVVLLHMSPVALPSVRKPCAGGGGKQVSLSGGSMGRYV